VLGGPVLVLVLVAQPLQHCSLLPQLRQLQRSLLAGNKEGYDIGLIHYFDAAYNTQT
jgi:hypothetical protein